MSRAQRPQGSRGQHAFLTPVGLPMILGWAWDAGSWGWGVRLRNGGMSWWEHVSLVPSGAWGRDWGGFLEDRLAGKSMVKGPEDEGRLGLVST